jgi:hypothetical protein
VAQQTGLTVYPEDKLTKEPITDFTAGAIGDEIVVDRATPVNVNLYGAPVVMRTHALPSAGCSKSARSAWLAGPGQPEPATPIAPNMQIAVIRNGLSTVTITEDIAMPSTTRPTPTWHMVRRLSARRAPGKKAVTYEINTQNGVEVGRRAIQATVIQPPVTEIRVVGANLSGIKGDMALAGIAPANTSTPITSSAMNPAGVRPSGRAECGGCPAYHGTPTSSASATVSVRRRQPARWHPQAPTGRPTRSRSSSGAPAMPMQPLRQLAGRV